VSSLISCRGLGKSYASRNLFEGLNLTISEGDRIGLIGPNGAGKTTLLRILLGMDAADSGLVNRRKGLRMAWVPQEPEFDLTESISSIVTRSAQEQALPAETPAERELRARIVMEKMGFPDTSRAVGTLSGGWRKRVAIAGALASNPELLFLDEPTNHLDLEGMLHLEEILRLRNLSFLLISHDRVFLDRTVSRIIEIAPHYPGGVFASEGAYSSFLKAREGFLKARAQYREGLANRVRRELEWLGRGPKARTTKAQSRIDLAGKLRQELRAMDEAPSGGGPNIELNASGRRSKRLLVASGISKSLGGRVLFSNLDLLLRPGHCMGVVGANGSGKSTLLKLLAGEMDPDHGTIRRAEGLRCVYFDQNREELDPSMPLRRCLWEHSDTVIYRDRPIHIVTWAKRFQFRVDQLDVPLKELSGGERARVHIARLMLRPADLLILDEPTNDLDIPTLEVLEESLLDFPGALVLVSHDRLLMDRVATMLLGLDGRGGTRVYAGIGQFEAEGIDRGGKKLRKAKAPPREKRKKSALSYLEKREYEGMEESIEKAEAKTAKLAAMLEDPKTASDAVKIQEVFEAHRQAGKILEDLYERWTELEEKLTRN